MPTGRTTLNLALGGAAVALVSALAATTAPGARSSVLAATPPPVKVALSSIAATVAPALTIRDVNPGGTELRAFATTTVPASFSYTVRQAPDPVAQTGLGGISLLHGPAAALAESSVLTEIGTPSQPDYETKFTVHRTGLTPNTTYDLDVSATTQDGDTLTAHTRFTTLKQRVRVTLDSIDISDDGDTFGSGEPTWFWKVGFQGYTVDDCYPQGDGHCQVGSASEGTVYPYANGSTKFSFVFAQENFQPIPNPHPQPGSEDFSSMPTQFTLQASANESDGWLGPLDSFFDWGAWLSGTSQASWQAPQGVEVARQAVSVAAEQDNFRSVMHFTFEVFYDNQSYPPNDGRVFSTSK